MFRAVFKEVAKRHNCPQLAKKSELLRYEMSLSKFVRNTKRFIDRIMVMPCSSLMMPSLLLQSLKEILCGRRKQQDSGNMLQILALDSRFYVKNPNM